MLGLSREERINVTQDSGDALEFAEGLIPA